MKRQTGFTLVEVAVALGAVAILSGIIIPLVVKNIQDSKIARARNDIQVIAGAIATQMKDMGSRPTLPGGPGGATGIGQALWFSPGNAPLHADGTAMAGVGRGAQTFANLFTAPDFAAGLTEAQGNTLFNIGANPESSYHGPYLASDAAGKTDPWGRAYVILGYNADSQVQNGPIWVVSAGPNGTIDQANLALVGPAGGGQSYNSQWPLAGPLSTGNIAVRVQ